MFSNQDFSLASALEGLGMDIAFMNYRISSKSSDLVNTGCVQRA